MRGDEIDEKLSLFVVLLFVPTWYAAICSLSTNLPKSVITSFTITFTLLCTRIPSLSLLHDLDFASVVAPDLDFASVVAPDLDFASVP